MIYMRASIQLDGSLVITPNTAAESIVLHQMVDNNILDGDTIIIDTSKIDEDAEDDGRRPSSEDSISIKKLNDMFREMKLPTDTVNPSWPTPFTRYGTGTNTILSSGDTIAKHTST